MMGDKELESALVSFADSLADKENIEKVLKNEDVSLAASAICGGAIGILWTLLFGEDALRIAFMVGAA